MKKLLFALSAAAVSFGLSAQTFRTSYPDIPRIDVHMHMDHSIDHRNLGEYLKIRDQVMNECGADVAMWINMTQGDIDSMQLVTDGRMLCSFSSYRPAVTGIEYYKKEDIDRLKKQGYLGYKLWYGPYPRQEVAGTVKYRYIDDPAHEKAFAELEKQDVLMTSLHIADPNGPFEWRTKWMPDPVEYWRQITGFERVLHRHPNLRVIAAHAAWCLTQDAQIDYLRYMLDTYPNLNIDIASTFQYSNLQSYDNLRDFYIKYQDRIVWGTDNVKIVDETNMPRRIRVYVDWFRFLETDEVMDDVVTNDKKPMKGLALPREILEKIYYKNALRLYPPALAESMRKLGYKM